MLLVRAAVVWVLLLHCVWARLTTPNCSVDQNCPHPLWLPQYQLNMSTVVQPCNETGFYTGPPAGIMSFDWSNAKQLWLHQPLNDTNCEELLVQQAKMVKDRSPNTKVFVYRNLELALEWLSTQRKAMYDPTKKDWFLQYRNGSRKGEIYNEQTPFGDQYFWDFTNPAVVDYWLNEISFGPTAAGSPYVDGIFTDDVTGIGQEHDSAPTNMGMTQEDIDAQHVASNRLYNQLIAKLVAHNAYNWQAFGDDDGVEAAPSPQTCAARMRELCTPAFHQRSVMLQYDPSGVLQNVAAFLIARGDYWWLGYGWSGCSNNPTIFDPILNMDVGIPFGQCEETAPGVFQRIYTKGSVRLDCNNFQGHLDF